MNKYLLILCFAGVSLGQLARFPIADGVAITLLDMAVVLFVSNFLFTAIRKKQKLQAQLTGPLSLFVAACVLSLLVNLFLYSPTQIGVASLYLIRWILYAGVYFAVLYYRELKEKELLFFIIGAGIVQLIGGLWQYYFFPDLRVLYYLGWDDHLYRLIGVFIDPNYQGAMFVLLFIVCLALFIQNMKHITKRLFGLGLILLLSLSEIVLTYSRSALVMLIASFGTFFFFLGNKKLLFMLSGIALLFVVFFSNTYIEGLNPFRTASIFARISSMKEAAVIIQDNPVFGVGFNTFRYAQNKYGFRVSERWQISHADAGTDNSFLFVMATTGVVGLVAYLYLLYRMLLLAKSKMRKKSSIPLIAFVSIIGVMVDSLFVNSLFYPFFMFWMWMLLGFTENT